MPRPIHQCNWSKTCAVLWNESQRLSGVRISLIRQVMEAAPPKALNFALGELSFPMPQALKDEACRFLNASTPCYTPNAGLSEAREVIATLYPQTTAANICICNGAEEALYISLLALTNPGDTIAIPDPDYTAYTSLGRLHATVIKRLPFEGDLCSINWKQWEQILAQDVKLLMLSSPSNPSGYAYTETDMTLMGEICNRHGIIVVVDEIYSTLYFAEKPCDKWHLFFDRLVRINGLSKSHCLSGWRIGWLQAPSEIIGSMIKAKQYISTCSHWLSQKLVPFALSHPELAEDIRQQLNTNWLHSKQLLNTKLPPFCRKSHIPTASPYIMLKLTGEDDIATAKALAAHGIITVPGSAFGELGRGWIRMNIGVMPAVLQQGLKLLYSFNEV